MYGLPWQVTLDANLVLLMSFNVTIVLVARRRLQLYPGMQSFLGTSRISCHVYMVHMHVEFQAAVEFKDSRCIANQCSNRASYGLPS